MTVETRPAEGDGVRGDEVISFQPASAPSNAITTSVALRSGMRKTPA